MAGPKSVYVADGDEATWDEAAKLATDRGSSVAKLVNDLLRRYVDQHRSAAADAARVVVDMQDANGTAWREAFNGRWLVEPDPNGTGSTEPEVDAGAYYGVALTVNGRIVVYTAHCNDGWPPALTAYDTLDDAEADGLPIDIGAKAGSEIGEPRTIVRDW